MPSPARSSLPPTGPGAGVPSGDARVIPFRSERVPPQGDGESGRVDDPQARLVRRIQQMFLADGQTLNDPATAKTFRTTVDAVSRILGGALNQDVIDQSQHEFLSAWLHGLRAVPDGLSRGE